MKKIHKLIILVTATCLSTAGFVSAADSISSKAISDLNNEDLGTICGSIWCAGGSDGD